MLTHSAIRLELECRAHRHRFGPIYDFGSARRTGVNRRRAFDPAP